MTTFRKLRLILVKQYGMFDARMCALVDDATDERIDCIIDGFNFEDDAMVAQVRIVVSDIEVKGEKPNGN